MEPPICANCETPIGGKFCSNCGQEWLQGEPTLKDWGREVAQEFFNFDGRAFQSLKLLFTQPGALTLRFFEGKRASFVAPLKLYVVCSAIYFFAAQQTPFADSILRSVKVTSSGSGAEERKRIIQDVMLEGAKIFEQHMEHVFIFAVPFTALASYAFFKKRGRGLLQHLVFVLHNWSAIFLVLAVLALLAVPMPFFRLLLAAGFVYQVFAIRTTFQARWPESFFKSLLLSWSTVFLVVIAYGGICVKLAVDQRVKFEEAQRLEKPASGVEP